MTANSVFAESHQALMCSIVRDKLKLVAQLQHDWQQGRLHYHTSGEVIQAIADPGRPKRPELVAPRELVKRKVTDPVGHAALLHAIAHIEFNAINLALDAVYRFQHMPRAYYTDWIQVAFEESQHFTLLSTYLLDLQYAYGDFVAHNSLWQMAQHTASDVLLRMALVPRVLEARGLDVTPGICKKLAEINDQRGLDILAIIERDEIGHVAIGSRWFRYLCQQRQLCAFTTFAQLVKRYASGHIKAPFAVQNRLKAGFSHEDLALLEAVAHAK